MDISPFVVSLSNHELLYKYPPFDKLRANGILRIIMPFYVYILHCSDSSYYTGHTDNLEKRLAEHMNGAIPSCYTFKRRPLNLIFSQEFPTREEALVSERQIKGWSRKKKEAMIRGDWEEVSRLAKS
jgi:predicted GIY-YIG superfamily endonuclease